METKTKMTQCERIVDYMIEFGSISTLEAFNDLGVARLASRIYDLKKQGYSIASENRTRKNRYASPCEDRHKVVSRLYLQQSRSPIYQGQIKVRRGNRTRTVSFNGGYIQRHRR